MSEPLDINGREYPIEVITPKEPAQEVRKRRFRKVYFHTSDNKVVPGNYEIVNAYVNKDYADKVLVQQEQHFMWEDKNIPIPVVRVEGFYLVHESLFDTILKPFAKDDPSANG